MTTDIKTLQENIISLEERLDSVMNYDYEKEVRIACEDLIEEIFIDINKISARGENISPRAEFSVPASQQVTPGCANP